MSDPLYGGKTVQELLALCAVATPGPWIFRLDPDSSYSVVTPKSGETEEQTIVADIKTSAPGWSNGYFIAAARNALPDLLARVKELEATINKFELRLDNAVFALVENGRQERDDFARRCIYQTVVELSPDKRGASRGFVDAILAAVREEIAKEQADEAPK